ncbi:MAG: glycosyltransferase [Bacteroidota bacterium]
MTPPEPKLSIAVTTYNHEQFIARALDSILTQQVAFDYEIVIGEDCSRDSTLAIIYSYKKKFPERIRILERNKNLGYVRNFDETLKACRGTYIAIADGDDIMLPGKLQKQVDFLDRHPEAVMVGHDARSFDSSTGKTIRIICPRRKKDFYRIEDLILHGSFFANSSKMFRRAHLPPEGIDPSIKIIADWYITLQIVKKGQIGYIHETLCEYRIHPSSIMQTLKGKSDFEDKMFILNMLRKEYGERIAGLFHNQLAYAYLIYGIHELNSGRVASAREKLLESIKQKFNYTPGQYYYLLASYSPSPLRKYLLNIRKS